MATKEMYEPAFGTGTFTQRAIPLFIIQLVDDEMEQKKRRWESLNCALSLSATDIFGKSDGERNFMVRKFGGRSADIADAEEKGPLEHRKCFVVIVVGRVAGKSCDVNCIHEEITRHVGSRDEPLRNDEGDSAVSVY
jgi:hypothetical protein